MEPPARGSVVRGGVRVPRTSPRNCRTDFAKLLKYVDPDAQCGFGFDGAIVQPGALLTDAEMWPSDEFPRVPILLESAVIPSDAPAARKRNQPLYVLWRYDLGRNVWIEIARAQSESWHWALELRAIAVRALAESRPLMQSRVDLPEVRARIAAALERELKNLDSLQQWQVLSILHDQLAVRAAAAAGASTAKIPLHASDFPGNPGLVKNRA
jgi:hypothetical protein